MQLGSLHGWAQQLPEQIARRMDPRRYGNLPHWQAALRNLPQVQPGSVDLARGCIRIGDRHDLDEEMQQQLERNLRILHPWRKGPFELFGVHIDTEWRSDWKWQRIQDHIQPLDGRWVLDVGCGNGYHCLRMLAAGAQRVIGIDPTPLFVMQFEAIRAYLNNPAVNVLPLGIDDVPASLNIFDTVFSMGVLYHRRSPLDHLLQLRDCLRPGGELVLETLVIDSDEAGCLFPRDRYASMGNVWFIPSVSQLELWLHRCKFTDIRVVNINTTTVEEQRATQWMTFQSLSDFLDPQDGSKTIEGYPAPVRATLVAKKPRS